MLRTTSMGSNMKLKPPFFCISDTHWFHKNIISYCNRPENHNNIMVERWNKVVGPNDIVLHLGDLVFTPKEGTNEQFFQQIAPALNGQKYLILGNHDKQSWRGKYERAGFKVIKPFHMRYREHLISFDHYPAEIPKGGEEIRVHGHLHNNPYRTGKNAVYKKYGNINVSVEVVDYYPQSIEKLLDREIALMKQKLHYRNVGVKRGISTL